MEFLKTTGIMGFGVVGIGLLLLLVWIIAVCTSAPRKLVMLVAVLAILPLLVGLGGAGLGHASTRASIEAAGIPPDESAALLASGQRQANKVGFLGLGVTVVLWTACAVSYPFARRDGAVE